MKTSQDGKEVALRNAMKIVQKGIDLQEMSMILRKEIIDDFTKLPDSEENAEGVSLPFEKGKLKTKKEIYTTVEKFIEEKLSIEDFKDLLESWIIKGVKDSEEDT